jgi:hypothetical protein
MIYVSLPELLQDFDMKNPIFKRSLFFESIRSSILEFGLPQLELLAF